MNVNVRADMLRANSISQPANMLAMGNAPFIQNSAQIGQQQLGQNSMSIPSNINPNPSMAMLPASGMPMPNAHQNHRMFAVPQNQNQQLLNQQQAQQQQQMFMRQSQPSQQINHAANSPVGARMAAMNPTQLQGMGFSPGMVNQQHPGPNAAVRRVPSQNSLNAAAHLGNMSGVVTGGMSMGIHPQPNMHGQPTHLRPAHQSQPMRSMQQPQIKGVPPDLAMGMNRQGGNHVMTPTISGLGSTQTQVMNSLTQPPSMSQQALSIGIQQQLQNSFQNGPIPNQHQQPSLSSSPRPASLPPSHTGNIVMGTPGPSHTPVNRSRMTPDNTNPLGFVNYPAPQFPLSGSAQRVPPTGGQYSFAPSSTPPMSDIQHTSMSQGMINAQGNTQLRPPFHLTPAQQYEQMNNSSNNVANQVVDFNPAHYPMPPPSVPPRPPSHNNAHNPMTPLPMQQHTPQLGAQQTQSQHSSQSSSHPSHHPSPLQSAPPSEHLSMPPARPQSRPRSQPQTQPPSQPPLTPRSVPPPLPPGPGLVAQGRRPLAQQQANVAAAVASGTAPNPQQQQQQLAVDQQQQQTQQHLPIAPRPPPPPPTAVPMPPTAGALPQNSVDAATAMQNPRAQQSIHQALGNGQGLIRLLQFSGVLSSESKTKLQLSWWNDLVKEYFTPKAVMKFTLWKDNQKNEAKPFEIGLPILPRFFLVTTQSGVKSMTLSLDGARERMHSTGHAIVECVAAVWTYKYNNGYTVTLRGPLTAHVVVTSTGPPNSQSNTSVVNPYMLKFEEFQFDAAYHDKYIALEAITGTRMIEPPKTPRQRHICTPTSGGASAQQQQQQRDEERKWEEPRVIIERALIPGEPVNAFGIPQATMRCLELAESVGSMADLITFANETKLGPLDALCKFANKIRDGQIGINPGHVPMANGMANNALTHSFPPFSGQTGMASSPAVTLYSSAPTSVTNPPPTSQAIPPPSVNSPQNTSSSAANSPQKQHKTIPQPAASSNPSQSSGPAVSPSVSSGATTNTPSLSNASLKRKQTSDTASPTTSAPEQPPAKRATRKRGRTTGTG